MELMHTVDSIMAANATNIVNTTFDIMDDQNGIVHNYVRVYSPLLMCNEWSKTTRLLFILFCICFGSIMNGFFLSSFFVESALMRMGNLYHACIGLADLVVTAVVMPISAVLLLSGQWDNLHVCNAARFIAEAAIYAYRFFFLFLAVEDFYRICRTSAEYDIVLNMGICYVIIALSCFSLILAATSVILNLDYDYCERRSYGSIPYRITSSVLFHGVLTILTLYCLIAPILKYRRRARQNVQFKRSQVYKRFYCILVSNFTAYVLFIISWIPYVVVIIGFPLASDAVYYSTAWLGLLRCVFTSFFYAFTNEHFRRAYTNLFYYCCCKEPLPSLPTRNRRVLTSTPAAGRFISVHVMQRAIITNSPRRRGRGASISQETHWL